ncbi:MAG TPA: conjugative transposon protein TraM, partial [Segetibacter sp.]
MDRKNHSQKFLRQRKLLLLMPLIVLPFITLMFWALGGGKGDEANAQQTQEGFNMQLPGANLNEDKPLDKLTYYEKAASDSAKLLELMRNDPYYRQSDQTDTSIPSGYESSLIDMKYSPYKGSKLNRSTDNSSYGDPNEAKVYNKLAELNTALNSATTKETKRDYRNDTRQTNTPHIGGGDADRLEQMMQSMNQKNGDDPEMQQLSGMMEKILDIQHPERVKEKIREISRTSKGKVFAVSVNTNKDFNSLLKINKAAPQSFSVNRFYSLDEDTTEKVALENSINAVVHQSQVLVDGSIVKLRLVNDVFINGMLIPKNNFVFGVASLNGERLVIKINSIRYNSALYSVDLSVFDMDGMAGIYIPGAITRDVAKQSADRAVQGIGFTTLDPSFKVQAASTGVEAAKALINKRTKL